MAHSQVCRCVSINPGMTMSPVTSMTWASAWMLGAICTISSPSIRTSPFGRLRSEERRVGKECRSRWSGCDEYKKLDDEVLEDIAVSEGVYTVHQLQCDVVQ